MKLTVLLVLTGFLAACGGGSNQTAPPAETAPGTTSSAVPSVDERAQLFAYDQTAPLNMVEKKTKSQNGADVVDVVFDAADRQVSAFLVRPKGKPKAAVLWAHWYGEEANPNRKEFLADALALAKAGVVSLLRKSSSPGRRRSAKTLPSIVSSLSTKSSSSAAGSTFCRSRPATSPSASSATTTERCSVRCWSPTSGRRPTS
jgi:hypothetical protein